MNITANRALFSAFLFIINFWVPTVAGQDFPMLHYTTDDGLPSNKIYEIYKDSKGFLWLGTDKGCARYNGIKFEIFTTFDGLPDNEIFFFQEDQYGRIWLGTYNGELCYYQDGTFHTAANTPFLRMPFKTPFISQIAPENDSSITIRFQKKDLFINIRGEKYNVIYLQEPLRSDYNPLLKITKINDSLYKVIYRKRIVYVDPVGTIVKEETYGINNTSYLFVQNKGYLYNSKGVYTINNQLVWQFKRHIPSELELNRIYFDDKNLFLATNAGLFINETIHALKGNIISSVTQDVNGNYWISTLNHGVYEMKKNFLDTRVFVNCYIDAIKYAFSKDNHLYFTTSTNGIYGLSKNKCSHLLDFKGKMKELFVYSSEPGQLIDSNFHYLGIYYGNLLTSNDLRSQEIKIYKGIMPCAGIKTMLLAGKYLFIRNATTIQKTEAQPLLQKHLYNFKYVPVNGERIFHMEKDEDENIWYSTLNKVYKIVDDTPTLQSQFKNIDFKLFCFLNHYLLGYTHGNQFLIAHNYNDQIIVDSIAPQNCIWDRLYPLDSSHILISTNNLYRLLTLYPPGSGKKCTISAIENPFLPLQAEMICPGQDGHCYFIKNGSITSLDMKSIYAVSTPPSPYFKSIEVGKKDIYFRKEIALPFRESRNITLSFSAISFSGKDVCYQYSVSKNEQDNWEDVKGEKINLVQSDYGNYTIKIRARGSSGPYSTPVCCILHIMPPITAKWWFVLLSMVTVVGAVGLVVRFRILYVIRKKEKDHKKEIRFIRSEYRTLNALMNPHFIFNTLNNVQSLFNENKKEAANEYLRIFANLIRQNMQNISRESIPLQKEIDLVTNYLALEKLRFEELLNYSFSIDEDLELSDIMVPPLLIQPLVENSIKHGILPLQSADGYIEINVTEFNNILSIEVRDNGIGIQTQSEHTNNIHESYGLANIKKRIEQLNLIQNKEISFHISEIKDLSGKNAWTIVTISIPLSEKNPPDTSINFLKKSPLKLPFLPLKNFFDRSETF